MIPLVIFGTLLQVKDILGRSDASVLQKLKDSFPKMAFTHDRVQGRPESELPNAYRPMSEQYVADVGIATAELDTAS
jgi:hypothetical protein